MSIAILVFLWKNSGFIMLIFWVGLSHIPVEYYEVADIEGASLWKRFRYVTFIYLLPIWLISILIVVIQSFKIFKEVFMLFGNYPNENIYLLQHYMNNQFYSLNMQKLTTSSFILFFIIASIIGILFLGQRNLVNSFTKMNLGNVNKYRVKNNKTAYIFLIITTFFAIIPLVHIVSNSFMSSGEIINRYTSDITIDNIKDLSKGNIHFVRMGLIPDKFTIKQYIELLSKKPTYLRLYWNSILIIVPVLIGQCFFSPLAACGFEFSKLRYKEVIFYIYIVIMLMPIQVLLVPNYLIANWLGFLNSYLAIILPGIFAPLGVFIIRLQLKGFPKECIEASKECGANQLQIYRYIILPNIRSSITLVFVITFAEYWNVIDQAIIFIKDTYNLPLSIYLSEIAREDLGMFFTTSCFYLIPVFLIALTGKEYIKGKKIY